MRQYIRGQEEHHKRQSYQDEIEDISRGMAWSLMSDISGTDRLRRCAASRSLGLVFRGLHPPATCLRRCAAEKQRTWALRPWLHALVPSGPMRFHEMRLGRGRRVPEALPKGVVLLEGMPPRPSLDALGVPPGRLRIES